MKNTSNDRSRSWFLTINQNADCYNEFESVINSLDDSVKYAYISHNLDYETIQHYHLILIYPNARYFNSIQKTFNGSHIEKIIDLTKCTQYLIHKNDVDKYQYSKNEVKSNCFNYFDYYFENESCFPVLDDETLLTSIENKEILSITSAVKKFGIKQVSRYRTLIQTLIEENISNVESYYRTLISNYRQRLTELLTINEMQQHVLDDYDSYFAENGFIKRNRRIS